MSTGDLFDFLDDAEPADANGAGGGRVRKKDAPRVLTVTQLTRKIRNLLELQIGTVDLQGEISNLRRQNSGHVYFTLKDAGAQISCVLFRSDAARVRIDLRDGIGVQLRGEISVYEPRGNYQIIVRGVQAVGEGALQVKFDALKKKLHAEGLFDPESKRPLPRFPRTICLITSPTGAALRDMLNILKRRAPWVRVLVYPVRVQGDAAAGEIARALGEISNATNKGNSNLPQIDTVVVTRGGGSLEDLWAFNEEVVARALCACPIPVVSAVGHEIDFTISDFAADLRAPTPSAAAELIVPDGVELRARLRSLGANLTSRVERNLRHWETVLQHFARSSLRREPRRLLDELEQDLDRLSSDLQIGIESALNRRSQRVAEAAHRMTTHHPGALLDRHRHRLSLLGERLGSGFKREFTAIETRLEKAATTLRALGPEAVFARGYTATTDAEGNLIRGKKEAPKGTRMTTHFGKDESVESTVE